MEVRRSYVNSAGRFTPIVFAKRCFAEARSICLGRSEPRFLLRLRGNHTGSASTKVKRSVGILGGETAKQHLPSAELRDGPRPSVLAVTLLASHHTGSAYSTNLDALAFRGRSPCVTKRATHPRVFSVESFLASHHTGIASASQKRGQSVSDGVSRASFCVFAVTTLAVLIQHT